MTNYLITQAINIAVLIAFAAMLVLRTRAEFKRRIRVLEEQTPLSAMTSEQRKLELRTQIETLQHELNELDRAQVSALRPTDRRAPD